MTDSARHPARYVVVGSDGSDASILAMRWAVRYAHLVGARIIAVTAYAEGSDLSQAEELQERTVSRGLGTEPLVDVERQVLQMRPAQALTLAARGAEVLVVGSHGDSVFPGMHLGSVANYCVNHAPCPVVVYREPGG